MSSASKAAKSPSAGAWIPKAAKSWASEAETVPETGGKLDSAATEAESEGSEATKAPEEEFVPELLRLSCASTPTKLPSEEAEAENDARSLASFSINSPLAIEEPAELKLSGASVAESDPETLVLPLAEALSCVDSIEANAPVKRSDPLIDAVSAESSPLNVPVIAGSLAVPDEVEVSWLSAPERVPNAEVKPLEAEASWLYVATREPDTLLDPEKLVASWISVATRSPEAMPDPEEAELS